MEEFTIKVGSKDSEQFYSTNRGENFICRLLRPIEFDEPFVVALQAIVYTTVPQPRHWFSPNLHGIVKMKLNYSHDESVTFNRNFDKAYELLTEFNRILKQRHFNFKFAMKYKGDALWIKVENKLGNPVKIDSTLSQALGFSNNTFKKGNTDATKAVSELELNSISSRTDLLFETKFNSREITLKIQEPDTFSWQDLINCFNMQAGTFDVTVISSREDMMTFTSDKQCVLEFDENFEGIFGIKVLTLEPGVPFNVKINPHLHHTEKLMVVKTNVVQPSQYGNFMWPVIRTMVNPGHGVLLYDNFVFPEYHYVSQKRFEEIHVSITDERGEPFKFEGNAVSVILRFRRAAATSL